MVWFHLCVGQHIKMDLFYVSVFITISIKMDDEHIVGQFVREKGVCTDLPSGSIIMYLFLYFYHCGSH